MSTSSRQLTVVAGAAWLAVAASGTWLASRGDDGWETPYLVLMVSLLIAALVTTWITVRATSGPRRPWLRRAGIVALGLGCFMSIAAWAVPAWMFLLGVGFMLLAFSTEGPVRRAAGWLGMAQLVGIPVLILGIQMRIGWKDEYGDYPLAGVIGIWFTVALTVAGLVTSRRELRDAATTSSRSGVIAGAR